MAPKLSIGLPVYNGQTFLSEAIDSILNQTYIIFELIICDNGSTDDTEAICRRKAKSDHRIKYYRHAKNRGATFSHNFVIQKAKGEYFKLMACDDLHLPQFLEKCIKRLERNDQLVLAYTRSCHINASNQIILYPKFNFRNQGSVSQRFIDYASFNHYCNPIFGVMRRAALLKTSLFTDNGTADRLLLAELSLLGPFDEIRERLFYFRRHKECSSIKLNIYQYKQWWNPGIGNTPNIPFLDALGKYICMVLASKVSILDKIICLARLMKFPFLYRKAYFNDVIQLVNYYNPFQSRKGKQ